MNTSMIIRTYEADGFQIGVPFTEEAYFNATEAAKAFGKRPNDWLVLPETQRYLSHLPAMLVNEKDMVITKPGPMATGGGTWLHPKLAIVFARWLDIRFSIWCDMQIWDLLRPQPPVSDEMTTRLMEVCGQMPRWLTLCEQMTGLLQRLADDPGRSAPMKPAADPRPLWLPIMETVLLDISNGWFNFPYQFKTLQGNPCLLIRCSHVVEYLQMQRVKVPLSARALRRELTAAGIVLIDRQDPTIEQDRHYHFLALSLTALAQQGLPVPGKMML